MILQHHIPRNLRFMSVANLAAWVLTDEWNRLVGPSPTLHLLTPFIIPSSTCKDSSPTSLRCELHVPGRLFGIRSTFDPLHLGKYLLIKVEGEGVIVPPPLGGGWEKLEEEGE